MSREDLQKVHELLVELQQYLKERFDLELEIEKLPINLNIQIKELNLQNSTLESLNSSLLSAKEEVVSYSIKYDDAFKDRTDSERKMDDISTQKEYEALSKQIDEAKIKERSLLNARNSSQKLVQDLEEQIAAQEIVVSSLTDDVNKLDSEINSIIAEKKAEIEVIESKCNQIRESGISQDMYAKFSNIVKNKNGVGIVGVQGSVCTGCHMVLPLQFVNDIRLGENTEYCPYCSRILFYDESSEDEIIPLATEEDESLSDIIDESDFDL